MNKLICLLKLCIFCFRMKSSIKSDVHLDYLRYVQLSVSLSSLAILASPLQSTPFSPGALCLFLFIYVKSV